MWQFLGFRRGPVDVFAFLEHGSALVPDVSRQRGLQGWNVQWIICLWTRHYVPHKRREPFMQLRNVIVQKKT